MKELTRKIGLHPKDFYQHLVKDSTPEDMDFETIYPDGDGFIPVDQLGSLLLFACTYRYNPTELLNLLNSIPNQDLLALHIHLVDSYLDEANFNIIDSIVLLGMIIEKDLDTTDIPAFSMPQTDTSSEFLEYLQVSNPLSFLGTSVDFVREWLLQQQLVLQRIYDL